MRKTFCKLLLTKLHQEQYETETIPSGYVNNDEVLFGTLFGLPCILITLYFQVVHYFQILHFLAQMHFPLQHKQVKATKQYFKTKNPKI